MARTSSSNGKGKTQPVQEQEQPKQVEIPIEKQVIRHSKGTSAERTEDGKGLIVSFIVMDGGSLSQETYVVEEQGKQNILDAATGGIQVADLGDIPKERAKT